MTANLLDVLPLRERHVALAGLFRTRSGLRRGTQLMLRDLRRRNYVVNTVDLSAPLGFSLDDGDSGLLLPRDLDLLTTDALILPVNPPRFAEALDCFSPALRRKARIIGYWVWELDVLSDAWRDCAQACDTLWAPSPFVADALRAGLPQFQGDIAVVPYQVDLDPLPRLGPAERQALRRRHGLEPSDFLCGVSFPFWSNFARKNPLGAIDAFRLAFPPDDNKARLLIRANDSTDFPDLYNQLLSYAAQDSRVTVFDPRQRPWPVGDFLSALDVFVSLHRSEGYGLQIVEAAQAGTTVLATGWGLAPDIAARPEVHAVDYKLVRPADPQNFYNQFAGARWAEPDLEEAAQQLQRLRAEKAASA